MPSDDNESRLNRYKARLTDKISDSEVIFQTFIRNIQTENSGSQTTFKTSSNSSSNISTSATDKNWKCNQLLEAEKQWETPRSNAQTS